MQSSRAWWLTDKLPVSPPVVNRYVIIYLWRGERHRGPVFPTLSQAQAAVVEYRIKGFAAWIEEL